MELECEFFEDGAPVLYPSVALFSTLCAFKHLLVNVSKTSAFLLQGGAFFLSSTFGSS